jgi:HAMP domain-containing protein
MAKADKADEATHFLLSDVRKTQTAYMSSIETLIDFQAELMNKAGEQADKTAEQAATLILTLAIAALVLGAAFALWITRSITQPVNAAVAAANALAEGDLTVRIDVQGKDEVGQLMAAMQAMVGKLGEIIGEVRSTADNLSNASGQVSATAQSLSQSSSEQAASVEETTSSMEQMSASILQNTENAKVTDGMASTAARQAVEGGDAVAKTVEAMKSIADKIGIIDDIAYQTNLLALERGDRSRARRRARQGLRRRRRRSPQACRTFAGRRAGDQQRRQGFGQARRARRCPARRNGAVDQEDFRPRPGNCCVLAGTVLGRRPDQRRDGPTQPGDAAERFGIRGTRRDRRGNGRAGAATAGSDDFLPPRRC